MSIARSRAMIVTAAFLLGAAALSSCERTPAHEQKPTLLLLTSLPLVFGEQFSLEGHGSPALDADFVANPPDNGFLDAVDYQGAVGPGVNWILSGWASFSDN